MRALLISATATLAIQLQAATYDFPIYKNKPAGKQVSGQHAAAATPALSPAEAQRKFALPPGFEIRLFAAEPEVVNPVTMTWDERGRLWVLELYEYPMGAAKGEKPRDRIKILEDTDGDGRADKVHVWADNLNLATGLLLGHGGAYVGQAPHLLHLRDTNGDDRADKTTVLMTGFGLEDRHELLNGFTWGPDGQMYMTHGVFTRSSVKNPERPDGYGVNMDAAIARYNVQTRKIEVYADGTSNPWGVDFDRAGNAFLSACVIDHMFHMSPGGIYVRQGGQPQFPYAYQLLPSIVDHRHKMAAFSGIQVYLGDQWPAEHLGTIFCGNIHDNAVHQDTLTPNGSSFKSSFKQDFVRANDGWFRPVSQQVGPDGALWIADWYDKYPCYQNARADPEGVDREHGRIWRVVWTGNEKGKPVPSRPQTGMNLAQLTSAQLVDRLAHPNIWQRKMAQRILNERRDDTVMGLLQKQFANGKTLESRLTSLWTLYSSGYLADDQIVKAAADKEPAIRAWAARFIGEHHVADQADGELLAKLAADPDPSVRVAVAVACRQLIAGSLTVTTSDGKGADKANTALAVDTLAKQPGTANDPLLPFMIWMAAEPYVAANPKSAFDWLAEHGAATMPFSGTLAYKIMRRVTDLQKPQRMDDALNFLAKMPANEPLLAFALNGLVDGQKGKAIKPTKPTEPVIKALLASPREDVARYARQLGALWDDAGSIQSSLALINDAKAPLGERIKAIQIARQLKNDAAREALLKAIAPGNLESIILESIAGLSQLGGDTTPDALLAQWKNFSPAARRATAETLASRPRWAAQLLSVLEQKRIVPSEIPPATIRSLTHSPADFGMLGKRATAIFGRIRDADADKLKIIAAKKKMTLANLAAPDIKAGHEMAKALCLTCHKLHGEGAEVGPDLTGVGRSSIDALLANIIDPNQIIGAGYELVEIQTKDDRDISGRMIENSDIRVRLLALGGAEAVIAKSDIKTLRIRDVSVMPEGLENLPDDAFANLIWFLLNPPKDNRPWTPALRKELLGDETAGLPKKPTK